MDKLGVSERRACRVLGQARSTQRRRPVVRADEDALTRRIIDLASCYGRYGYLRVTKLLKGEGWRVNKKRVERIWKQEGLKVPVKQPKRGRLWLCDGSCIRLRPEHKDHVWSYDFIHDRTSNGRSIRILTVIDEYTRECLALRAERSIRSEEVLEVLDGLCLGRGVPEHIRSDNGPEMTSDMVRTWLKTLEVKPLYIEPGSPWENGYVESFHGRLRDESLNGEVFDTLREAQVLLEQWRRKFNAVRPNSSLGYRPPAPETWTEAVARQLIGALRPRRTLEKLYHGVVLL
jgi:putative transposase